MTQGTVAKVGILDGYRVTMDQTNLLQESQHLLMSIDEATNRYRIFFVRLRMDRHGYPVITRKWGRIVQYMGVWYLANQRWGGIKSLRYPDMESATSSIQRILKEKRRRNYADVPFDNLNHKERWQMRLFSI